jgi:periplasmic mercuric ion binding protein
MKSITLLASLFIFSLCSFAQTKTETIKVWGNCGMCQKTIETAAKKAGASQATWNEETKMLAVTYKAKKTSAAEIQKSIAEAGYDTQDFTANDEAYKNLHGCCQYDRKNGGLSEVHACCSKDASGKMVCTDTKCTAACCKTEADGKKVCLDNKACAEKGCCKKS